MKDLQYLLSDIDVGLKLLSLYEVDILICTAECFIAAPDVSNDAVFIAVVEASVTDGMRSVAKVMAGLTDHLVVVGVILYLPICLFL